MSKMVSIVDDYEEKMLSCVYKKYLGIECPGCGMQRAFALLMKGEVVESLKMFPALIPIIFMLLFLVLHLLFKFNKGHLILLYLFILNATIIVVNYIVKLLI